MKDQKEIVRELNQEKIIRAAETIFAQYGFKGATTEKISKQAQLPKANIHYYFKTKENLYHAVLENILNEWMDAAKAFDNFEAPRPALTKYVESKMAYSRTNPNASKVWANEIIHGAPAVGTFLDTTLKQWLDDRVKVIQGWIDSGAIKPVDPRAFIYMIWSTTQHYADFERQIVLLNEGRPLSDDEFEQKTQQVVTFVLACVGL
ncbi:TetR family transcriptional regulator C-terminal domain-containing protein [Aliikangiella sp. IMCC44653]